jgi:adenine-specific DNA-methyltransferase
VTIAKLRPTSTLTQENLQTLNRVLPEAFADGKINWEILREILTEHLEEEVAAAEHFGLFWPGKKEARRLASKRSRGTLAPLPGEGLNEDETGNLFIEGDNLEVLKLLQKSYFGKIRMIYIDPPYNTGNDFIYSDNFIEPLEEYLRKTGQADEEGNLLTTNTKSEGRFHSKWLNMMYPRLRVARDLLREDGVIFISIDENESHHLRLLLDEIFGEENFINSISVKTKESSGASGGGEDKKLKKNVETLLFYCRSLPHFQRTDVFKKEFLDEIIAEKLSEGKGYEYRQVLLDPGERTHFATIEDGQGQTIEVYRHNQARISSVEQLARDSGLPSSQIYSQFHQQIFRTTNAQTSIRTRVQTAIKGGDGLFSIDYVPRSGKDKGALTTKFFWGRNADLLVWLKDTSELEDNRVIKLNKCGTLWDDFSWTGIAKEGGVDFPNGKKPVKFIRRMLEIAVMEDRDAIVMDFFAGSGTTAHALLEMNREDGGNRKFILVQLPEKIDPPTFPSIADLTKERIRNVIRQASSVNGSDLFSGTKSSLNEGFKVFKLQRSNLKVWQDYTGSDLPQIESLFSTFETPLVDDWKEHDLLIEVMLLKGFPLDSIIKRAAEFNTNKVTQVESISSAHRLFLCFEEIIKDETIERAANLPEMDTFICLDSALTDEAKVRLTNAGNVRTI